MSTKPKPKAKPKTTTVVFYEDAKPTATLSPAPSATPNPTATSLLVDEVHVTRLASRIGEVEALAAIERARGILASSSFIQELLIPADSAETHYLRAKVEELAVTEAPESAQQSSGHSTQPTLPGLELPEAEAEAEAGPSASTLRPLHASPSAYRGKHASH